ncbi:MAG: oligosaccharide flippase family protein [Sulfitobacter sp.]
MFGSIGILLIGNVGGAFLTVLRTIVISRLISLEDFGIGTVLVLVLAMVEMISALGFQQQIVQASDGNGQSFQQKLQGVSILRGLLAGSAIYLLAHPISSFFDMPQTVGAIQFISIIPVILGFIHLDIHRLARQMKHFPSAIVALLPPLGSLISVVPLSYLYSDYRLMLFAVLVSDVSTLGTDLRI